MCSGLAGLFGDYECESGFELEQDHDQIVIIRIVYLQIVWESDQNKVY
jgi:hypothetical protein